MPIETATGQAFYDLGKERAASFFPQDRWTIDCFRHENLLFNIFDGLRRHSPDEQREFLVNMLGVNGLNIVNGEDAALYLARGNSLEYFTPQCVPPKEDLENLSDRMLRQLKHESLPTRVIAANWPEDWGQALRMQDQAPGRVWSLNWLTHHDPKWIGVWGSVWSAFYEITRKYGQDKKFGDRRAAHNESPAEDVLLFMRDLGSTVEFVCRDSIPKEFLLDGNRSDDITASMRQGIHHGTIWRAFKDFMPELGYDQGNPGETMLDAAELGLWVMGPIQRVNGKKEFTYFVPPIND